MQNKTILNYIQSFKYFVYYKTKTLKNWFKAKGELSSDVVGVFNNKAIFNIRKPSAFARPSGAQN